MSPRSSTKSNTPDSTTSRIPLKMTGSAQIRRKFSSRSTRVQVWRKAEDLWDLRSLSSRKAIWRTTINFWKGMWKVRSNTPLTNSKVLQRIIERIRILACLFRRSNLTSKKGALEWLKERLRIKAIFRNLRTEWRFRRLLLICNICKRILGRILYNSTNWSWIKSSMSWFAARTSWLKE